MNVLITGGAGFIGSHLAEAYLNRGDRVYVIDDLSTGSMRNIEKIKIKKKFDYIIDTVTDQRVTAEYVDLCDVIFHLAAAVGVRLIVKSPVHTIETNIKGTEVVLNLAAKKKKKVVVASSSEVYGKSNDLPFREDGDLLLGPTVRARWSYACSKAIDEFLALAYWKERGLPTIVVRLFNTVGPRQSNQYGMVIPTFVGQAISSKPITVYGNGEQSRCFTHVSDVVDALIKLSESDSAIGQVVNLGSRNEISILELARKVKELARSDSDIVFVTYSEAYEEGFEDMIRRIPDISKAESLIGYRPKMQIEDIILSVIEYYKNENYV